VLNYFKSFINKPNLYQDIDGGLECFCSKISNIFGSYSLEDNNKDTIVAIPFPTNGKAINYFILLQTLFSHISINSSTILMVLTAIESPQKDLLINTSHVSRQSVMAKILSRSTGNHHVTVY